jgi:3'-phosphoadenosine 5'-phosphosulfate (PAPS) 3'-phosphatase
MPGFKYWDMCASEALIQAMMGVVTDASKKPLVYDHDKSNYTIREGIIIAKNLKVFNLCEKRILKGTGSTIPEIHADIVNDYD